MTKRDLILTEVYESKEVSKAINKVEPKCIRDDLRQEVFMVLCKMEEEKLIGLYERKELMYYIVRIIWNMVKSTTRDQPFFRMFRQNNSELSEVVDYSDDSDISMEEALDKEQTYNQLEEAMQNLHWYEKQVLEATNNMTIRKLSEDTGIPYSSLRKTIKSAKDKVRESFKKD